MPLKFPRQRARDPETPGLRGLVRVDARTKNLTKRLRPGEIAVIDHQDIDKVSAEALLACRPAAVINAAPSISGRYPNLGPEILVDAGIPLIDNVGKDVMHDLHEGQQVRIEGDEVWVGDEVVAKGQAFDHDLVQSSMVEARAGLAVQLEAFAANTMEYLRRERELLLDGVGVPEIRTKIDGRHALIVVRGYHYKEDLRMLRSYIREYRPILIGVDGGADALLEVGLMPDLVVGDMDSVSDSTLRCGAEIVVHAYRDGNAPGLERVRRLGIEPVVFPATGTSEDVAMLLADDKGAELIVAVGTHATLVEFLDKGRSGMASTFLTRLRVGGKLIDAKGVSRLYRSRISNLALTSMLLVGLCALFAALWSTTGGRAFLQVLGARWDDIWSFVVGIVT
ncbi:putative membrane-anchored protein [Phycicoccus badiiscoriae]|uniref:Putative membrane-anchored protein n=1 Tax=Pedococcus badiiscoriae TaxID=642776 RepID=A0A852WHK4_9MICO|nr:putative cytokinetic ring protein SteA [Pedococcus badiiscoriae]NYG08259.1 putative membrane-anchored protein [Pedococcus badiiscoriae]